MSFWSWGKVILERMSFGLWIVSYFVTFKVQATAVKLQSGATPVLHESPMPAPATGSDGLTLCSVGAQIKSPSSCPARDMFSVCVLQAPCVRVSRA